MTPQILFYILGCAGWLMFMIWICMILANISATLERIAELLEKRSDD